MSDGPIEKLTNFDRVAICEMTGSNLHLLSEQAIENQLANIELLLAMFPDGSEIEASSIETTRQLKDWIAGAEKPSTTQAPDALALQISLPMIESTAHVVVIEVSVPIKSKYVAGTEAPPLNYRLRQPAWMTKAQVAELSSTMPSDDIFAAIDHVQAEAHVFLKPAHDLPEVIEQTPLARVWFYFPSLSTRSKRDDLVNNAPLFALTGFVLAGKPGMLCLEGMSANIDKYMQFIKTESWGDIPSHQKKVSERYRETGNVRRVFSDMQEITDAPFMGAKGGQRGNRGDMQSLESWLNGKGLGEAFENVIF